MKTSGFLVEQARQQGAAHAGDLAVVAQHFGIAAHGQRLRRPPGIETGALHLRSADAEKLGARQTALECLDQMGGQQVARGFARHQRDTRVMRAI